MIEAMWLRVIEVLDMTGIQIEITEQVQNLKLEQVMHFKEYHQKKHVQNITKNKSCISVLIANVSVSALNA